MRESTIETYLREQVEARGGLCLKFVSPGRRNVPDRLVLMPGGDMWFAECKAPGEKPTEAQAREHTRLRQLGFRVAVIDSKEAVDRRVK